MIKILPCTLPCVWANKGLHCSNSSRSGFCQYLLSDTINTRRKKLHSWLMENAFEINDWIIFTQARIAWWCAWYSITRWTETFCILCQMGHSPYCIIPFKTYTDTFYRNVLVRRLADNWTMAVCYGSAMTCFILQLKYKNQFFWTSKVSVDDMRRQTLLGNVNI